VQILLTVLTVVPLNVLKLTDLSISHARRNREILYEAYEEGRLEGFGGGGGSRRELQRIDRCRP
jgi:hypothetical protein